MGTAQFFLDVANRAGYNLPATVADAITGTPGAGTIINGISTGGNVYAEAIEKGYDTTRAGIYAVMTGISDMALNYLFDDIAKVGGKQGANTSLGKTVAQSLQNIKNANLRFLSTVGVKGLSKLSGPYLQAVLAPVYRNLALDENNEIRLISEEAAYEALLNFFTE